MFWAVANGHLDAREYGFDEVIFRAADTETLNRWASAGEADVCAVSIAHVPAVASSYLLLPHGGSLGRDYGPVVVAGPEGEKGGSSWLAGRRVGIPGERTTAARLLRLAEPDAIPVVVPFAATLEAIDAGEVEAAVLIHEGRLVYRRLGYSLVLDLGSYWFRLTGLPLPLGGNVIRRSLGDLVGPASAMCRDSIAYALAHRDEALDQLVAKRPAMSRQDADAYLKLYANEDTLDYGNDGRRAVERLLGTRVEWAP